jgi:outer membrane protein, heavy metal efflux system
MRSGIKFFQLSSAVFLLALASCGSIDQDLQGEVAAEAQGLEVSVKDDQAVRDLAEAVAMEGLAAPEAFAIPAEADMETYVGLALSNNPGIHRAIRRLQSLGYRVPQVTSLQDPFVRLIPPLGNMLETAAGTTDGSVGISQAIPFPGKLDTRGRIAEQEVRMAFDDLDEVRIYTIVDVLQTYASYYLAEASIEINRESETLLSRIRDVAAARYRSGLATQQDVLRAEVELYSLTNELITLEQEKASAVARLNALMNRSVDAELPPPKAFDLAEVTWRLTDALKRAVEDNPRLARLQEQIKRDLELIALADLDYYPDLTVGFSYTLISNSGVSPASTGQNAFSFPFLFNLPIWRQRLRAQILERNASALASVDSYQDIRNQIFFQLQDTLVKIDTQYRQAVLLRDLIVPRSWQAVDASTAAYRSGDLEFTALIENWSQWLEQSLNYHKALAGLEQRFADLQYLIGVRLPRNP